MSVTVLEDISAKKREIEAKLEEEKASLAWLKESLHKSDQLANTMVGILNSFEDRLCKLEDTILPVHKETTDLQRRQGNIDKTLQYFDEVLGFYNVSSSVKGLIESGPTGYLDDYLKSMEKIQESIKFFKGNNPESIELSLLKALNDTGREMLEKEFRTLLKRHSKPVPAVTILDILNAETDDTISRISAEEIQIEHFAEKTMEELGIIAKWLTGHGQSSDFMSVYSQIRSSKLQQSLEGVKEGGLSNAATLNYGGKVKGSTASITPIRKGTQKIKQGVKRATIKEGMIGHKRQPSYPTANLDPGLKDDDENSEVAKFITCSGALLKLIQSERQLMVSIIPEMHQVPIFSQVLQSTLTMYASDGESVSNLAKKYFGRLDHTSVTIVLPVLKYLRAIRQEFEAVLKMVNVDTRNKFLSVITMFEQTGWKALHEFREKLKETDKHVIMPKDGTVHQVTSNVMVFLEDLLRFQDTVGLIIYSQENPSQKKEQKDSEAFKKLVADYIYVLEQKLYKTIFDILQRLMRTGSYFLSCDTLLGKNFKQYEFIRKAKLYDSQALQAIFMLNNYNYIVKSLEKSGLLGLLENSNPRLAIEYDDAVEGEINNYQKSWAKVKGHILEENSPVSMEKLKEAAQSGHLKEKYRQAIKDKFKGFNTDFEDIYQSHKAYSIPDQQLRKKVGTKMVNIIVALYSEFLLRYRDIQFTKNPEKYIKYSVEDCKKHVLAIFGVVGDEE